ncbi:MAG: hypothetical protein JRI59_09530, partial [Deltaproteobacteria bacterium]|nr:hypothetical protein [Deltaproteobacteria bacterium]
HWLIILPVIEGTSQFVQQKEVLGFCAFEVVNVGASPDKFVEGWALGGYVAPDQDTGSPTGSPTDGLRAEFPKLVG